MAPLPYASDAFIPIITPECFAYHYGKHHSLYVSNLAKLIRQSVGFPKNRTVVNSKLLTLNKTVNYENK
ncbi:hypothetical protein [Myroides sp. LJL110]